MSEEKKVVSEEDKTGNPDFFLNPIGHPRDRIVINANEDIPPEGQYIGLNGYGFLAKTGEEIDLPRPVRKMLDSRIKTITFQSDDGHGNLITTTRDMKRITYTLIQEDVKETPGNPIKRPAKERMG